MKDSGKIINLPKQLFWDVDHEKIDYKKSKVFVIGRVLNYGKWEDVREVFEKYGEAEVKKNIVKVADLGNKTLSFWSKYFNISKEEFRCYIRKQLNPVQWSY